MSEKHGSGSGCVIVLSDLLCPLRSRVEIGLCVCSYVSVCACVMVLSDLLCPHPSHVEIGLCVCSCVCVCVCHGPL
jgi:hypothetical protein